MAHETLRPACRAKHCRGICQKKQAAGGRVGNDERHCLRELLIVVVSWNRPTFLRRTLESLGEQIHDVDAELWVVDNGSGDETTAVIHKSPHVDRVLLLDGNLGINGALEAILPEDVSRTHRHVLISDADMRYESPLRLAIQALDAYPDLGAVSLQHSPEHEELGRRSWASRPLIVKRIERGCALLLRSARLQLLRPLPVQKTVDFDWWVMRDAAASLQNRGELVGVIPGGALHLGWRAGASTWRKRASPEFDAFKT